MHRPVAVTAVNMRHTVSRIRVGGGLNGCFHWTGNFQVDCYTQLGAGELPNWTALDVVLSYFDSVKTLTTTNGLVITLQGGTPTPSLTEKQWIHGIARIPFFGVELP